jgi:hypothetical protein
LIDQSILNASSALVKKKMLPTHTEIFSDGQLFFTTISTNGTVFQRSESIETKLKNRAGSFAQAEPTKKAAKKIRP